MTIKIKKLSKKRLDTRPSPTEGALLQSTGVSFLEIGQTQQYGGGLSPSVKLTKPRYRQDSLPSNRVSRSGFYTCQSPDRASRFAVHSKRKRHKVSYLSWSGDHEGLRKVPGITRHKTQTSIVTIRRSLPRHPLWLCAIFCSHNLR